MARTIFVLNGLNPNLLGKHQPEIFGRETPAGFTIQLCQNEAEHISNVPRHEEFRHFSHVSQVAAGVIHGFGTNGYPLALHHPAQQFKA